MPDLRPTQKLVAAAQHVQTGTWTVPADEPAFPVADPELAKLVQAGYVELRITLPPPHPDPWVLTTAGERWLNRHGAVLEEAAGRG